MLDFRQVTTRGGDDGEASLSGGTRLPKDHVAFHALGKIDELSSYLGVVRHLGIRSVDRSRLLVVQRHLLKAGAAIAALGRDKELAGGSGERAGRTTLAAEDVGFLERIEHRLLRETQITDEFVLPGGTPAAAYLDVCRTVCREAERHVVGWVRLALGNSTGAARSQRGGPLIGYLNRLSDLLFVMARHYEQRQ